MQKQVPLQVEPNKSDGASQEQPGQVVEPKLPGQLVDVSSSEVNEVNEAFEDASEDPEPSTDDSPATSDSQVRIKDPDSALGTIVQPGVPLTEAQLKEHDALPDCREQGLVAYAILWFKVQCAALCLLRGFSARTSAHLSQGFSGTGAASAPGGEPP